MSPTHLPCLQRSIQGQHQILRRHYLELFTFMQGFRYFSDLCQNCAYSNTNELVTTKNMIDDWASFPYICQLLGFWLQVISAQNFFRLPIWSESRITVKLLSEQLACQAWVVLFSRARPIFQSISFIHRIFWSNSISTQEGDCSN